MIQEELLERALDAKEERADYQKQLLHEYKLPLISLTLNLAGGYFQYDKWELIWENALRNIQDEFSENIVFKETRMGKWGREGFFVLNLPVKAIKNKAIQIEDTNPLGRLFDIDVINMEGLAISRRDFNMKSRLCLICNNPALDCYIDKRHDYKELKIVIDKIIEKGLEEHDKVK